MADMRQRVIIWGAAGHARVLADCLSAEDVHIAALFDNAQVEASPLPDVPVYRGLDGLRQWRTQQDAKDVQFLIAIGGDRGRDRLSLQVALEQAGLVARCAVHGTAYVAHGARLGKGCQVLAHAVVGAGAILGDQTIINTAASVDHECRLGAGVHVAPGATLAGCVTVCDGVLIGAGAILVPRVTIGQDAIVGAGSVVTRDVPDNCVVWGNPARLKRTRVSE